MRRIGEVAAATGLTILTLHRYDDIGLLAPTGRSEAGYRLYGDGSPGCSRLSTAPAPTCSWKRSKG
jgi:hypothetical protein